MLQYFASTAAHAQREHLDYSLPRLSNPKAKWARARATSQIACQAVLERQLCSEYRACSTARCKEMEAH
eukprot:3358128-Pleurochrysis_carterae.AAC.1